MSEAEPEYGMLRYKRDQRRRNLAFLASMLVALVGASLLVYVLRLEKNAAGLDPVAAVLLAALFVAAMAAANWLYLRNADELTWAINIKASFWALMFFAVLYPVWLILWRGGLVPPPDAESLYLATLFAAGAVYLWKRFL